MDINQLSDYVLGNPKSLKEVYDSIILRNGALRYYTDKNFKFFYVLVSTGRKRVVIAAPPEDSKKIESNFYSYYVATKPECCTVCCNFGEWKLVKQGGPIKLNKLWL